MMFAALRSARWIDNSVRSAMGNEALIEEQKRTYSELTKYRDHLESEVAERTAELVLANARLTREIEEKEVRRKEAEQTQARFRELTDMLPEIVFELDAEGSITYVNRKFSELTGYPPGALPAATHATRLVTPEDTERFQEMLHGLLGGNPRPPAEYAARREGGSSFPVMMVCSPIQRD
jgi:PAS domain S-box-containing protein